MSNDNTDSNVRDTIPDLQPYCDAELDAAMRELLAIEAGERDLAVLREVWKQRHTPRRGLASRLAAWLTAAVCLTCSASAMAEEPAKPKRPTMCLQGQPVGGKDFTGFICLDGKRPRIFTRYIVVEFVDENGKPRTYTLGWTAPVKRTAKGGFVAEGTPVTGGMKL